MAEKQTYANGPEDIRNVSQSTQTSGPYDIPYQLPTMTPGQQSMFIQPGTHLYFGPPFPEMPQRQEFPQSGQSMPQMQRAPGSPLGSEQQAAIDPLANSADAAEKKVNYVSSMANSAFAAIKKGLHNVKVSRQDATEFERQLQGELFDRWHESWEVVKATKIPFRKITGYLNHLQTAYEGIDAELREKMNGMKYTEEAWEHALVEWKFNKENNSQARYGMIAFGRSPNGKYVDCMFVMYKMDFKVAPKVIVEYKKHSILFGLKTWQTVSSKHTEERSFGAKDNERLQNFFRNKAMEGFYKEGVIEKINYVKSLEEATKDDSIKS